LLQSMLLPFALTPCILSLTLEIPSTSISCLYSRWLAATCSHWLFPPMDWRIIYIIEKLLKCRCLQWARMTHLDIWNTSYGQKKGRESNWQFDSQPLKVKNRPNLLACRWCATYHWKDLNKGYNFASDLISIRGLHVKLWALKVAGVPTLAISGLPFENPETKCHLDVDLMERHKVYYKGEGGGFPQVWAVVSPSCPWLILAPKCSNYALTTLCWFCAGPCE
jgi:hypothetical protein